MSSHAAALLNAAEQHSEIIDPQRQIEEEFDDDDNSDTEIDEQFIAGDICEDDLFEDDTTTQMTKTSPVTTSFKHWWEHFFLSLASLS